MKKTIVRQSKVFRIYKYEATPGVIAEFIFGPDSSKVDTLPTSNDKDFQNELTRILQSISPKGTARVILVPKISDLPQKGPDQDLTVEAFESKGLVIRKIDGKPVDSQGIAELETGKEVIAETRTKRFSKHQDSVSESILGKHPFLAPKLEKKLAAGILVSLSKTDLSKLANLSEDFEAVEEYFEPKDDFPGETGGNFYAAFASSGLYTLSQTNQGSGITVYLTEGTCPDPNWVSNYTRLNGAAGSHSKTTVSILRAATPLAKVVCGIYGPEHSGFTIPSGALILTASYSRLSTRNNYATIDRDWDNFIYNTGVFALNSGSNSGGSPDCNGTTTTCHQVAGPGRGFNVMHVGNSWNWVNPDVLYFDSPWRNPNTHVEKPDFVINGGDMAPYCITTDCKAYQNYGTSGATPHAAGLVASLMSSNSHLKLAPEWTRAYLLVGATRQIGNNNCPQVSMLAASDCNSGPGGLRLDELINTMDGKNWRGTDNSAFVRFDSQAHGDPLPGNGTVDWTTFLDASSSKVRIALTWLTRGSYTYSHANDPSAIGTDLDMTVYDPDGIPVASSRAWDNSFELVEFDPQKTGQYRVAISRYANRDTVVRTIMAVQARSW